MDPLRLLHPLVQAAGPELRVTGREVLQIIASSDRAELYPAAPEWVRGVTHVVGVRSGVSPALLEAVAGELTGWDPAWGAGGGSARVGLMGLPAGLVNGNRGTVVATLEDLEASRASSRTREAAGRVTKNVRLAAHFIRLDADRIQLVQVLEYYAGLGRSGSDPSGRDLARRIMGRYLWTLLERLPRGRAAELLESFEEGT